MTEITLAAYLKQLLTPELVVDIIINGDLQKINLKNRIDNFFTYDKKLFLDLKNSIESFAELVVDLVLVEFLGAYGANYENVYVDVDELDNLFYIIVGLCEKNKIDKSCVQNFVRECVKAIANNRGVKNIIKDYQNKDCNQRTAGNRGVGGLPEVIIPEE